MGKPVDVFYDIFLDAVFLSAFVRTICNEMLLSLHSYTHMLNIQTIWSVCWLLRQKADVG